MKKKGLAISVTLVTTARTDSRVRAEAEPASRRRMPEPQERHRREYLGERAHMHPRQYVSTDTVGTTGVKMVQR